MPSKKPKVKDSLSRIGDYAIRGGPPDWADNHDFYANGSIAARKSTDAKKIRGSKQKPTATLKKRSNKNG